MPHVDCSPDLGTVARFFEAVHGEEVSEQSVIVLWGLKEGEVYPDGRLKPMVRAAPDVHRAAEIACGLNREGWDMYFGCSLQPFSAVRSGPGGKRGSADTALPGRAVWVDLDMKDKPGYPESVEDVQLAMRRMPLPPTMVVKTSGGGRHLYWIFNDLMEGYEVQRLLAGWLEVCRGTCKFRLDSVGDPARVMRVPGLFRPGTGTMVELLDELGPVYEVDDLDMLIPDDLALGTADLPPADVFVSERGVNPDLFETAYSVDTRFANLWNQKTNTRRWKDTSQSAWDWALLANAAELGWGPQDLTDLGIAYRLKCAERLTGMDAMRSIKKAARTDYWGNIVARVMAKSPVEMEKAVRSQEKALVPSRAKEAPEPVPVSEDALGLAVAALGVPEEDGLRVHEIVIYQGEEVEVRMTASAFGEERNFRLKDGADTLYFHTRLASTLRCELGVAVPTMKQKAWASHGNLMVRHMRRAKIQGAGSGSELLRTMIEDYMERQPVPTELDPDGAPAAVFRYGEETYLRFQPLLEWLRTMGERHNFGSLAKWLTTAGLTPETVEGVKAWRL